MRGLILAGGSGTRLWPLSREDYPKQFLDFGAGKSLLEQTVCRLAGCDLLVVVNEKHSALVREKITAPVVVEPEARSTAPAIALGIKHWLERQGASLDDICLVTPSDLYFENEEDFIRLLPSAEQAARLGGVVTFGILPTHPETGYGYLQAQEGVGIRTVERFVEKPNFETALDFVENGNYYWNAGIFLFQIGHLLEEFKKHAPEIFAWLQLPYNDALKTFSSLPKISIDHAIMEKTDRIFLVPYPSGWSDLGSWERLSAVLPKDSEGNFKAGTGKIVACENCLVFGEDIVTVGVKDLVVVRGEGKVIVCAKKDLHRIAEIKSY